MATIRAYAREGRIPATPTPGGQYRFDLAEVRRVLTPANPVAIQGPGRFVSVFASGMTAVDPDSTNVLSQDVLDEQARGGHHREARPGAEAASEMDQSPQVRQRAIRERHRATRGAAQVLSGAPLAAFSVLH